MFLKIYAARATRCLVGATYVMRLQRAKPCGISMSMPRTPVQCRRPCLQLCLKMPPLWQRQRSVFLASRKRLGHTAGGAAAALRVTKTKRPRNQLLNEPLWNFHRGRPTTRRLRPVKPQNEKPVSG